MDVNLDVTIKWNRNVMGFGFGAVSIKRKGDSNLGDLTKGLNTVQAEAVVHENGPLLILSGAGSGKTRVIAHRIAHLIQNCKVPPNNILAVTFTKKAAEEMRTRVRDLVGMGVPEWIGTFHSLCNRILRENITRLGYERNFTIYDAHDQRTLVKEALRRMNIEMSDVYDIITEISNAKMEFLSPDTYLDKAENDYENMIGEIYGHYQDLLMENNGLDFNDLIRLTVELIQEHPRVLQRYQRQFYHIMVDEYQDTNRGQYLFVTALAKKSRNLCVVGDDDQSIYGWRQADIRNILDFEKDYPDAKVLKLEQNYRSTNNILTAASEVIHHNTERKEKRVWTDNPDGDLITAYQATDPENEAIYVRSKIQELVNAGEYKYQDIAILYRVNSQSRSFETALKHSEIPHQVVSGERFFERAEIKDVLAYLTAVVNPNDSVSLRRIINQPNRGIGLSATLRIKRWGEENGMRFHEALKNVHKMNGLHALKKACIQQFLAMLNTFDAESDEPSKVAVQILNESGYYEWATQGGTIKAQSRADNIAELLTYMRDYEVTSRDPSLAGFLERVVEEIGEQDALVDDNSVRLMTLHSAKGLEFPVVFMVGVEEGLLPHKRCYENQGGIEEERRLCYVGITRAEKKLYVSHAFSRSYQYPNPSRFIDEMPMNLIQFESHGTDGWTLSLPEEEDEEEIVNITPPEHQPGLERVEKKFADLKALLEGDL